MELTTIQELAIAEFAFAYQCDTLIGTEVEDVIEVLKDKQLVSKTEGISLLKNSRSAQAVVRVKELLTAHVSDKQAKDIMARYQSGKLN